MGRGAAIVVVAPLWWVMELRVAAPWWFLYVATLVAVVGVLFYHFDNFAALTHDVEALGGVVYAYALEVEVFNGSVCIVFDSDS